MPREPDLDDHMGVQLRARGSWEEIARLAAQQHGVVAHRQLVKIGLSRRQIQRRSEDRQLLRIHRGVYAVGHARLTPHGSCAAGVLAGGEGAALSHLCAAANLELADRFPSLPQITTPEWNQGLSGLETHCAELAGDEIVIANGIPTTSVERTILDVSATAGRYRVERVIAEAEYRGLITPEDLSAMVRRYKGRRGIVAVREIHAARLPSLGVPRSRLEERFLPFLDRYHLPRPELNVPMTLSGRQIKVDCLWREARLALELDGRAAHQRAAAFESDRLRDRQLTVAGWRPMRVTWRHLDTEAALARDLRTLLTPAEPEVNDPTGT